MRQGFHGEVAKPAVFQHFPCIKAPHAWRGIKVHFHILILLEWNLNIMKDPGTGKICLL